MTRMLFALVCWVAFADPASAEVPHPMKAQPVATLEWVHRIWDAAPHNAFTDLARFKNRWYVVFREAPVHIVPAVAEPGGKIRVLRSSDAAKWESVALFDYGADQDLRDPKLAITPDGQLQVFGAVAPHARNTFRQSLMWRSADGTSWSNPVEIGDPDFWMWRIVWGPDRKAYGIGYGPMSQRPFRTRLYRSDDGEHFETLVSTLQTQPQTGETAIRFMPDGSMITLTRQEDPQNRRALLGRAAPPYTSWKFSELPFHVGGPNMIVLPDGRVLAASRLYSDTETRVTGLSWVDVEAGTMDPFMILPSRGDSSYAGLVWHDSRLWISYYSSHEGKAAIYIARVRFTAPPRERAK